MLKSRLTLCAAFAASAVMAGSGGGRHVAFDLTASPALADVEDLRPARVAGRARRAVREPGYRILPISGGAAPRLVNRIEPEYTAQARRARIQGKLVLECVVNSRGVPERVRVVLGLEPGLDSNAAAAVRRWRFEPAMKDGKPVPVRVAIEVSFKSG